MKWKVCIGFSSTLPEVKYFEKNIVKIFIRGGAVILTQRHQMKWPKIDTSR
jgi:hypothetical protein